MVGPGNTLLQSGIDENSQEEGLPETEVFVEDVEDQIEINEMNYETNRQSVDY